MGYVTTAHLLGTPQVVCDKITPEMFFEDGASIAFSEGDCAMTEMIFYEDGEEMMLRVDMRLKFKHSIIDTAFQRFVEMSKHLNITLEDCYIESGEDGLVICGSNAKGSVVIRED